MPLTADCELPFIYLSFEGKSTEDEIYQLISPADLRRGAEKLFPSISAETCDVEGGQIFPTALSNEPRR